MKNNASISKAFAVTAALMLLGAAHLRAGSATWLQNPVNSNWNSPSNWTAGGPPNGPMDTATLGTSTNDTLSLLADTEVNTILLNGDTTFDVFASPGFILFLTGAGITNNNPNKSHLFVTQTNGAGDFGLISFFNNAKVGSVWFANAGATVNTLGAFGGVTRFANSSSAGSGNFANFGGAVRGASGGSTVFFDDAKAGSGIFTNYGGAAAYAEGGRTNFNSGSSAQDGAFTNSAGVEFSGGYGGITEFSGTAGAASGTFNNNGSTQLSEGGGLTRFTNMSGAASARLIANSGTSPGAGGAIVFDNDSTGGTARVEVFGNGILDIRQHNAPGVTIGSLGGNGLVFLGRNNLTVGSNNLSTLFSGVIQEGDFGGNAGSLTKIGTGTLALLNANTYVGGTAVTAGRLLANNSAGSAVGTGGVMVINGGAALGGTGTVGAPVTIHSGAMLSGGDGTTASGSLKVAGNVTLNSGAIIELALGASGAHSTLTRAGGTWIFASNQAFAFINLGALPGFYDNIITGLAGDPGGVGSWTIATPGFAGTFGYDGAGNIDLNLTSTPGHMAGALANISTRLRVETGDNALIAGFIITGTQNKRVIVRAIGPSLPFADKLENPTLELRNSSGDLLDSNDNWVDSPNKQAILDSTIPPGNDFESAIVANLPANSASYTAIVRGAGDGTGIGVVETYDLDSSVNSKLANISTRGFVQTGDNVLIAGTIVTGQTSQRVIIRAIGPSLPIAGKMENPTLELRDSNGALLQANDNWVESADKQAIIDTTIPPANDLESAIVAILPANNASYTAIVRGVNDATGIAVVEVYALP